MYIYIYTYIRTSEFWPQYHIRHFGTVHIVRPVVNGRPREATGEPLEDSWRPHRPVPSHRFWPGRLNLVL